MASLLGRLLRLFPESVPLEDLFTEAVARLFEKRPQLCLTWLEKTGLLTCRRVAEAGQEYVRIVSQRTFASLEHQDTASRPDLLIEVYRPSGEEPAEGGSLADVVMVESKIGSKEEPEQLKRYAEHLNRITNVGSKVLVYITRGYEPKDSGEILFGLSKDISFKQLRWHDFYRFLQTVEKDALVEEVIAFMEEQGMARSYRFSVEDLMALSGVPRAFEIFDETLGGEVRAELEAFAGNKVRRETHSIWEIRTFRRYLIRASLHGQDDLFCYLGYQLGKIDESAHASILRIPVDGYPAVFVSLEAQPEAVAREASIVAMKKIALNEGWEAYNNEGWEAYNIDNPAGWVGVRCARSLASLLSEEDHVAAVKRFFVGSTRQLKEELTAFKKQRPDLPWAGG